MEPSSTTGRQGTLENPEVREDVPGHIIPIIQREFDDFDTRPSASCGATAEEPSSSSSASSRASTASASPTCR